MPADAGGADFLSHAEGVISLMRSECRPKTVHNCQTALRSLRRFVAADCPPGAGRLPLALLTPDLISRFHRHLLRRGLSENTAREYLRSLRSVANRCSRRGLRIRRGLFRRVSTAVLPSFRETLREPDLRRLYRVPLRAGGREAMARDLAVFSYLSGGIPYSDLARLRDSDYDPLSNLLTFRRRKTGVPVSLRLTPEALRIWRRYSSSGPYHFGLLPASDGVRGEREYANSLARYNRALCRVALRCGIGVRVTSYSFRHAFASVARNDYGAPVGVISASLGHRSERTTAIYISRVDNGKALRVRQRMERGLTGGRTLADGNKTPAYFE